LDAARCRQADARLVLLPVADPRIDEALATEAMRNAATTVGSDFTEGIEGAV